MTKPSKEGMNSLGRAVLGAVISSVSQRGEVLLSVTGATTLQSSPHSVMNYQYDNSRQRLNACYVHAHLTGS